MMRKLDFKKEAKKVIANGKYWKGKKGLSMYIIESPDGGFGIITKSINGGVKRNKLKRRVRDILQSEISVNKNWIVIELNGKSVDLTYSGLKQEIYNIMKEAKIWQN